MSVLPDADRVWLIKRSDARDTQTVSGTSWAACSALAEQAHPGCELLMVEIADDEHFRLYAKAAADG